MNPFESQDKTATLPTLVESVLVCLAFFTRLPVGAAESTRPLGAHAKGFGPAGFVIGSIVGLVLVTGLGVGFSALVSACLALGTGVLLTGGLHEDGLADTADGFGGGQSRERKLAIMRDSRIGTYGVLALIFSVVLRLGLLSMIATSEMTWWQIIVSLALVGWISRAALVAMMYQLPQQRSDGLAHSAGAVTHDEARNTMLAALFVVLAGFWLVAGPLVGVVTLALVLIAYGFVYLLATRQIGGYTGDVLGALQQVSEGFALCGLAIAVA